ncbi:class I SAM-dependent methyltransferase [Kibdelosporangium aridum]|uniref:Class I SAM-dependent methyltransferase n=1 Tax=Kibdelosporangium aridum TaxID=2030 RepID=A0A428ZB62_KIBAR|nr:class I SAM-dependent methyltransferase [Kibdelosporangium aridum]RSM85220.1 class I SAM-dependent methyltransferase [Kibdelosporangium aridum]
MRVTRPTTPDNRAAHWNTVYDTKGEDGVSWYQATPAVTLELLDTLRIGHDASVIDLGGGASVVVDHLLARQFTDVSLLDVSKVALDNTKARLGPAAEQVHWLHRDIFDWTPERRYDLWHDRAVFHFLIDEHERDSYLHVLRSGTAPDGKVIIATFDTHGPTHCSGLPVVRYNATELAQIFAPHFHLLDTRSEEHLTPAGLVQPFTWVALTPSPDRSPG